MFSLFLYGKLGYIVITYISACHMLLKGQKMLIFSYLIFKLDSSVTLSLADFSLTLVL
jgi:hypothetical protein